jgi:hypothetical protein
LSIRLELEPSPELWLAPKFKLELAFKSAEPVEPIETFEPAEPVDPEIFKGFVIYSPSLLFLQNSENNAFRSLAFSLKSEPD